MDDGSRPDLIAWLPDAPTELGAPIIVEVKRARWPRERDEGARQLGRYMGLAGVRTGLLVTPGGELEIEVRIVSGGYLYFVALEALLDLTERGELVRGLIQARNRFVHTGRQDRAGHLHSGVRRAFEDGDAAATAHARGQALEGLLIYVFRKFPGVRFLDRDVRVANNSEEIDLVFWNDRIAEGLPFLPNLLLFECKNWTSPVDSASVVYFINKIRTRHLEYGFLIASNDVTGDHADLGAAHQHLHNALIGDNVKIIIINRGELCALTSTKQFTTALQQKIAQIILRGA